MASMVADAERDKSTAEEWPMLVAGGVNGGVVAVPPTIPYRYGCGSMEAGCDGRLRYDGFSFTSSDHIASALFLKRRLR